MGLQILKDHKILYLRAEVKSVSDNIGSIVTEIGEHITDMEQARLDDLLQSMMFSYSTTLYVLISKGEALLNELEVKHNTFVNRLSKVPQADLQKQLMANFFSCKEKLITSSLKANISYRVFLDQQARPSQPQSYFS